MRAVSEQGTHGAAEATPAAAQGLRAARLLRPLILGAAAVLFALHFLHLSADFPNDAPWMDWAKYTDEGWYADAAIRHFLFGHWYVAADFNPAVALPAWPLLLAAVFAHAGVSLVAARATTVCVFGVMLGLVYWLVQRFTAARSTPGNRSLAAPGAVLLLCASPFFYAFDRLAILEPLLSTLSMAALLVASLLRPGTGGSLWSRKGAQRLVLLSVLGVLLPAMVLTKTTAVALFPSLLCMLWHRAGGRLGPALRLAAFPFLLGLLLWSAYVYLLVRPHYMEDYQYLFSANAYTGFQLQPLATVLFNTFADGYWMGVVLYPVFFAGTLSFLFLRPAFFRNPLVTSLLFWLAGYFLFLAYHNNLQPRYYLVPAVPLTILVAMMVDDLRQGVTSGTGRRASALSGSLLAAAVMLAILIPDAVQEISFLRHPEYTYVRAADALARVVRADKKQSPLLLSVSGSDLTLMTGLPSIDDDFGTMDLEERVRRYHPGWYVAWNQIDDDKMDALTPLYQPVRVATYPVMDDPDRNQLILYRLDPAVTPTPLRRRRMRTPRPLRTRLGQQPTTTQLKH